MDRKNNFIWAKDNELQITKVAIPIQLIENFWDNFTQIPIPILIDVYNFINKELKKLEVERLMKDPNYHN